MTPTSCALFRCQLCQYCVNGNVSIQAGAEFVTSNQMMNVESRKERLSVIRKARMAEKLSDHVMMPNLSSLVFLIQFKEKHDLMCLNMTSN